MKNLRIQDVLCCLTIALVLAGCFSEKKSNEKNSEQLPRENQSSTGAELDNPSDTDEQIENQNSTPIANSHLNSHSEAHIESGLVNLHQPTSVAESLTDSTPIMKHILTPDTVPSETEPPERFAEEKTDTRPKRTTQTPDLTTDPVVAIYANTTPEEETIAVTEQAKQIQEVADVLLIHPKVQKEKLALEVLEEEEITSAAEPNRLIDSIEQTENQDPKQTAPLKKPIQTLNPAGSISSTSQKDKPEPAAEQMADPCRFTDPAYGETTSLKDSEKCLDQAKQDPHLATNLLTKEPPVLIHDQIVALFTEGTANVKKAVIEYLNRQVKKQAARIEELFATFSKDLATEIYGHAIANGALKSAINKAMPKGEEEGSNGATKTNYPLSDNEVDKKLAANHEQSIQSVTYVGANLTGLRQSTLKTEQNIDDTVRLTSLNTPIASDPAGSEAVPLQEKPKAGRAVTEMNNLLSSGKQHETLLSTSVANNNQTRQSTAHREIDLTATHQPVVIVEKKLEDLMPLIPSTIQTQASLDTSISHEETPDPVEVHIPESQTTTNPAPSKSEPPLNGVHELKQDETDTDDDANTLLGDTEQTEGQNPTPAVKKNQENQPIASLEIDLRKNEQPTRIVEKKGVDPTFVIPSKKPIQTLNPSDSISSTSQEDKPEPAAEQMADPCRFTDPADGETTSLKDRDKCLDQAKKDSNLADNLLKKEPSVLTYDQIVALFTEGTAHVKKAVIEYLNQQVNKETDRIEKLLATFGKDLVTEIYSHANANDALKGAIRKQSIQDLPLAMALAPQLTEHQIEQLCDHMGKATQIQSTLSTNKRVKRNKKIVSEDLETSVVLEIAKQDPRLAAEILPKLSAKEKATLFINAGPDKQVARSIKKKIIEHLNQEIIDGRDPSEVLEQLEPKHLKVIYKRKISSPELEDLILDQAIKNPNVMEIFLKENLAMAKRVKRDTASCSLRKSDLTMNKSSKEERKYKKLYNFIFKPQNIDKSVKEVLFKFALTDKSMATTLLSKEDGFLNREQHFKLIHLAKTGSIANNIEATYALVSCASKDYLRFDAILASSLCSESERERVNSLFPEDEHFSTLTRQQSQWLIDIINESQRDTLTQTINNSLAEESLGSLVKIDTQTFHEGEKIHTLPIVTVQAQTSTNETHKKSLHLLAYFNLMDITLTQDPDKPVEFTLFKDPIQGNSPIIQLLIYEKIDRLKIELSLKGVNCIQESDKCYTKNITAINFFIYGGNYGNPGIELNEKSIKERLSRLYNEKIKNKSIPYEAYHGLMLMSMNSFESVEESITKLVTVDLRYFDLSDAKAIQFALRNGFYKLIKQTSSGAIDLLKDTRYLVQNGDYTEGNHVAVTLFDWQCYLAKPDFCTFLYVEDPEPLSGQSTSFPEVLHLKTPLQ